MSSIPSRRLDGREREKEEAGGRDSGGDRLPRMAVFCAVQQINEVVSGSRLILSLSFNPLVGSGEGCLSGRPGLRIRSIIPPIFECQDGFASCPYLRDDAYCVCAVSI
jgi:hypothetical protein